MLTKQHAYKTACLQSDMLTKQSQTYGWLQHEVLEPSRLQYSILRLSGVTAFTNVSTV